MQERKRKINQMPLFDFLNMKTLLVLWKHTQTNTLHCPLRPYVPDRRERHNALHRSRSFL